MMNHHSWSTVTIVFGMLPDYRLRSSRMMPNNYVEISWSGLPLWVYQILKIFDRSLVAGVLMSLDRFREIGQRFIDVDRYHF